MKKWYVETLNGSSTEVVGKVSFDANLGLLEFFDAEDERIAFFNLAALAFAELIVEDE